MTKGIDSKGQNSDELDFVVADEGVNSSIELSTEKRSFGVALGRAMRFRTAARWGIAVALLGASVYYLMYVVFGLSSSVGFPLVAPGSYLGVIEHAISKRSDDRTIVYVEREAEVDSLFFAVLRAGFKPVTFHFSASGDLAPLTLVSEEGKLRFSGKMLSPGVYAGEVENLDTEMVGSWTISNIPSQLDLQMSPEASADVERWLSLRAELLLAESRIKLSEARVPEQKREIEKLTTYLTEGRTLKNRSDKKLTDTQSELGLAQAKLRDKQREANDLAKQLEISQKVTDAGKLVALSRDSLERERRWIESMFKTSSDDGSAELIKEIERGERVLDLRAKIAEAKNKLSRLLYEKQHGTSPTSPETIVPGTGPAEDVDVFTGKY